ncbi:succinylglutamate desuccinylase/aspartoacylase family protein [Kordiimonas aquimaris]|uniref:succinylglutamate desuccinylase/aspartoacylase family protein n=1 Tax=Kordiimonas aquimaris TaxID=707591 RepID=UPI0021CFDBB4|nr:succinylglutamate desuccinylase/aspartoacylase family protein [Kordiimonas aquimaris]
MHFLKLSWIRIAVLISAGLLLPAMQNAHASFGASLGDAIEIEMLNAAQMDVGIHRLKFRAGSTNTGQPIWVPIIVAKGAKPGPKLLLTAAVHGDELNGIAAIHSLIDGLDTQAVSGLIVAVPGLNQPGMIANSRHFVGSDGGGSKTDLNRIFPGRLDGGDVAERYVARLWASILSADFDLAVDLHTQTIGTLYPLFVFSDFRNDISRQMAFDLMPDMIKNDAGQKGTLETSFLSRGIPAVTFEVGGPKKWQPDLIARAVSGLRNLMIGAEMIEGVKMESATEPFVGSVSTNVYTEVGGFAYLKVGLKEHVRQNQVLAVMLDAYGQEIATYVAPHDGIVLSVATDPLREPGAMLVRILR